MRKIRKTLKEIKNETRIITCRGCGLIFTRNDIKEYKIYSIFRDKEVKIKDDRFNVKERIMLCEPCFLEYIKANVSIDEMLKH